MELPYYRDGIGAEVEPMVCSEAWQGFAGLTGGKSCEKGYVLAVIRVGGNAASGRPGDNVGFGRGLGLVWPPARVCCRRGCAVRGCGVIAGFGGAFLVPAPACLHDPTGGQRVDGRAL